MKRILILCAFLGMALPAMAGHKPWYKNPAWYARRAIVIGALVADGKTTCDGFAHGYRETSIFDQGGNTCPPIGIGLAGAFVFYESIDYLDYRLTRNDPSKTWRFAGRWAIPATVGAIHGQAAGHNVRLP